jgi:hypothetical protein
MTVTPAISKARLTSNSSKTPRAFITLNSASLVGHFHDSARHG